MALAFFIYEQALQAQDDIELATIVLMAGDIDKPIIGIQACAWLQWYGGDPYFETRWIKDQIPGLLMPPCVNEKTYWAVEKAKHRHREAFMMGHSHFCKSLVAVAKYTFTLTWDDVLDIRALDFEPNVEGRNAAREILLRIHNKPSEYDKEQPSEHGILVHTKMEHQMLYWELNWNDGGNVIFPVRLSAPARDPYSLQVYVRPGAHMQVANAGARTKGHVSRKGKEVATDTPELDGKVDIEGDSGVGMSI